ncbi:hypothetical protein [Actinoplanes derwentensis]|uniref:hypothetical protein n=1 Tax=Actinoplanes derwentensis TaxID=113562 RepID=UPI001A5FDE09|nr:hypothetical protein [Actinoplanes derwentensis]GID89225.1 hypothetical protein Ade03nite_81490 [Actinoplanes derwentensis]
MRRLLSLVRLDLLALRDLRVLLARHLPLRVRWVLLVLLVRKALLVLQVRQALRDRQG